MKLWNVYGRDCFGRLWHRGMINANNPREALYHVRRWRRAIGGTVISNRGDLASLNH